MTQDLVLSRPRRLPRGLLIGAAISVVVLGSALLGLFWTPYDPTALSIVDKLQPASARHWLGTDQLGRDLLSMLLAGARSTLGVALLAVLLGLIPGVLLGLWAAARGGWLDELLMRGNDLLFAFPALLLAILLSAVFGPGVLNAVLAIGIFNVPVFARVTRGGALPLWQREFIQAARVAGKGDLRISLEHVLPNLRGLLIVQATLQFSLGIVAEASLSYVGLGNQPPLPSWGRMLNEAQTLTALAPGLAFYPGLVIALAVLGLNLLGDGLRDRFDPKTWSER
jgi:peptide/nickel transport system permease protein